MVILFLAMVWLHEKGYKLFFLSLRALSIYEILVNLRCCFKPLGHDSLLENTMNLFSVLPYRSWPLWWQTTLEVFPRTLEKPNHTTSVWTVLVLAACSLTKIYDLVKLRLTVWPKLWFFLSGHACCRLSESNLGDICWSWSCRRWYMPPACQCHQYLYLMCTEGFGLP